MTLDFWCSVHSNGDPRKPQKTKPCITIISPKKKCSKRSIRHILIEAHSVMGRENVSVKSGELP